jgi:hypothetical protein
MNMREQHAVIVTVTDMRLTEILSWDSLTDRKK